MSFSLCREEGWILRSDAGLGFKDWESLGSGRNSFPTLGVQGLWDLKPEPLPLKLLCMKQATSAPSPYGAFQRHQSAKKRHLSQQNQHQRCTVALRGAGESDPLSKESTTSKKLSPQPMFQGPMYTSDDDHTHLPFLRIAPYISKQITEKTTVQLIFHTLGRGQKKTPNSYT